MRKFPTNIGLLLTLLRFSCADKPPQTEQSVLGCSFDNPNLSHGFTSAIYQYDTEDATFDALDVVNEGKYLNQPKLGTFSNEDAGFNIATKAIENFGSNFNNPQFIVDDGYFNAPETGLYRFDLQNCDNGAHVLMGTGAFQCCSNSSDSNSNLNSESDLNSNSNTSPFALDFSNDDEDSESHLTAWVHLDKGTFYPFKFVYLNAIVSEDISLKVRLPSGSLYDVADYVFQVSDSDHCSSITDSVNNDQPLYHVENLVRRAAEGGVDLPVVEITDCHNEIRTITCTTEKGAVPYSYEVTSCAMPDYMVGSFGPSVTTGSSSIDGKLVSATITHFVVPSVTCSTVSTLTDAAGTTSYGTCFYGETTVTFEKTSTLVLTTSCSITQGTGGYFANTVSTTTLGIKVPTPVEITNFNVAKFSPVSTYSTILDPTGNTRYPLCYNQFSTLIYGNSMYTTTFLTTSCSFTAANEGTFITRTYDATAVRNNQIYFLHITNTDLASFQPTSTTMSVTNPVGAVGVATCAIQFTNILQQTLSPVSFLTTSCTMPTNIQGDFEAMTTVTSDSRSTYTLTNIVSPSFSPVETNIQMKDYDNKVFQATCNVAFTQGGAIGALVNVPTTSCKMPADITGFFTTELSTTTLGKDKDASAMVVTNTNEPVFEALIPLTNPGGIFNKATCEIQFTTERFETYSVTIPTTSCEMPSTLRGIFETATSSTLVTFGDDPSLVVVTNTNVPSFSPAYTSLSVTNPAGVNGIATCAIQLITQSTNTVTVSIPTTSCEMPESLSGSFTDGLTTISTTVEGNPLNLVVTNTIVPQFAAFITNIEALDLKGHTETGTCQVAFTTLAFATSSTVVPTTSCDMPADISASFVTTTTTTVLTSGTTISAYNILNVVVPTFSASDFTSMVTNPAGTSSTATCHVAFITETYGKSSVSVATTDCEMPEGLGGSFTLATSTTTAALNDGFSFKITVTNTNIAVYDAVQTTLPVTNPAGKHDDATCEIEFTTQAVGTTTVSIPTTSCSMPADLSGTFIVETSTTTYTDGKDVSNLVVTNLINPQYSAAPTTLIVTDSKGQEATASCLINLTQELVETTTVAIPTTTCELPDVLDGFFVAGISTTVYTEGATPSTLTVTNFIVPHFGPIVTTFTFSDPLGKAVSATCDINMTRVTTAGTTIALPTTSCDKPEKPVLDFVARTSTKVVSHDGNTATITVTNTALPSFPAAEQTISITDLTGHTEAVTCAVAFTEIDVLQSITLLATTSCSMPEDIQGTFSAATSTATVSNGDSTTVVTLTNINEPHFSSVSTTMVVVDPTSVTGEAACVIDATSITTAGKTVMVPTTSCQMPEKMSGTFNSITSSTVFSGIAITVTNTNVPTFAAVMTVVTVLDPAGKPVEASCRIQITVSLSTAVVATTSCSLSTDVMGTVEAKVSTTVLSADGKESPVTFTNVDAFKFSPVEVLTTVTNPAGVTGKATCAIAFTENTAFSSTFSIPTTSCAMPSELSGKFVKELSTTSVTSGTSISTIVVTNVDVPSFTPNPSQSSASLRSSVSLRSSASLRSSVSLKSSASLKSITSLSLTSVPPHTQLPSNTPSSYTTTLPFSSTPSSVNPLPSSNRASSSNTPSLSFITITDPKGNVGQATCEINPTIVSIDSLEFAIPTTSCVMPVSLSGSFVAEISTTTYSSDDTVAMLTLTNWNHPSFPVATVPLPVTDPAGKVVDATCAVSVTEIDVGVTTVTIPTTSCELPSSVVGVFVAHTSTTVITIYLTSTVGVTATPLATVTQLKKRFDKREMITVTKPIITTYSSIVTTLTITNYDRVQYGGFTTSMTFADPTGGSNQAVCKVDLTAVAYAATSTVLPTTSCTFEDNKSASFVTYPSTTIITNGKDQYTVSVVNTNVPKFQPVVTIITLTDKNLEKVAATCDIDFTSVTVDTYTISVPTTSCEMPEGVTGTFIEKTSVTVVVEGTITSTIAVTNVNEPSISGVHEYTTTLTNTQGDVITATCSIGSTSVPVLETAIFVPTTLCSMPENVEGSFEKEVSTTVYSTKEYTTTITVTNATSAKSWAGKAATLTVTTTVANVVCSHTSTTTTSTLSTNHTQDTRTFYTTYITYIPSLTHQTPRIHTSIHPLVPSTA
ncbi:hypothetical protein CANINC_002096 [Pichia inconspicua]|uniref:PA14 domain-containing protein n=1 Tax=Pichia inconspicua TaxID=52247 RepID=A0A4T0X1Z5_9ASCO|nr:hypothetical protein CANINC_002096 [[Candida] inconspicua]